MREEVHRLDKVMRGATGYSEARAKVPAAPGPMDPITQLDAVLFRIFITRRTDYYAPIKTDGG